MSKPNVILQAARLDDIDAAAWTLQDALGVATGDLAGQHMPNAVSWPALSVSDRLVFIGDWLRQEALDLACPENEIPMTKARAIALGLPGAEMHRARFWFVADGGDLVKIKMETGDVLRHSACQETDEGWNRTSREWWFDGETLHLSWHRDGRDCDGRLERSGSSTCHFDKLQAGYESPDHIGVRFPVWEHGPESQRDHTAEAAGY